jgi:DNA-binding Lrp family transcriptional regulator
MESILLDSTDLQLLNLLQTDAAQSNQSLAEQVHVSPPVCAASSACTMPV